MFYSLKSRLLVIAGVMFSLVITIAIYGRIIFEDTILYGVENTQKQQNLYRIIVSMKYPLSAIEGKLYEYLISLDDQYKETIPLYIFELEAQLDNLKADDIINETEAFILHVNKLDKHISKLKEAFTVLTKFSRRDRYPITKIVDEKLNPTSQQFFSSIQILTNFQDVLKTEEGLEDIDKLIQELRYVIVQNLSSTRLLFVSQTGIFGSNQATISFIVKNQREYQNYLNEIVSKFDHYLKNTTDIDLEVEEAILVLIKATKIRESLFQEIVSNIQSEHWRRDFVYMEKTLKPILESIQAEFNLMERRLEKRSINNTLQTQEASNLLSNFLWVFAGLIMVLFILIYFFIEHWLRTPLIKISNAMNFERGSVSGNTLREIGLKEIDQVISAFNLIRKEIKTRQQRLSFILQNVGEGIIVVNNEGQIDSFNAMAEDIFKTTENNVKNTEITALLNIHSINADIKWLSNIESDSQNKHLYYFLDGQRSDGEKFKSDVTLSHMKLNNQDYAIIVTKDATNRLNNQRHLEQAKEKAEKASKQLESQVKQLDKSMSELKETQKQLIESEKNASLSGLVAGVAHEINTPIGVSVTASSHLSEEIKDLNTSVKNNSITKGALDTFIEDAFEASNIINNNLQRAANLVKSFKMVAVDQTSNEIREINLKDYIDEVLLSLRPKLKKTQHKVINDIDETININTSPGALSQVFTNLIINSLIHGFEGIKEGHIQISSSFDNHNLSIFYKDDGSGMNDEQQKKIFEPFFTTKRGEGGSGLGMHIVHNLITQTLKGSVSCKSSKGLGCQFELKLPTTT